MVAVTQPRRIVVLRGTSDNRIVLKLYNGHYYTQVNLEIKYFRND